MNPIPPWRAIAIARRESVTVSIAAATMGIFSGTLRARQVRVSACVGSTEDLPGSSRTSSNVSPSGMAPSIINFSYSFAAFRVAQKNVHKQLSPAGFAGLDRDSIVATYPHG